VPRAACVCGARHGAHVCGALDKNRAYITFLHTQELPSEVEPDQINRNHLSINPPPKPPTPTPISPQPSGGLCRNLNPSFGNDHSLITRAIGAAPSPSPRSLYAANSKKLLGGKKYSPRAAVIDITTWAPTAMSHDSDDDDLMDLEDLRFGFSSRKKTRRIKYDHTRINWDEHIDRLVMTNKFEQRFRMPLLCAVAPPIAAICVVSPLRRQSPSRHPLPPSSLLSSSLLPSPLRCRRAFCRRCVAITLSIAVVAVGRRAVWPRRFGPPCCRAGTAVAVAAKPLLCCPRHCHAATTSAALLSPPPCKTAAALLPVVLAACRAIPATLLPRCHRSRAATTDPRRCRCQAPTAAPPPLLPCCRCHCLCFYHRRRCRRRRDIALPPPDAAAALSPSLLLRCPPPPLNCHASCRRRAATIAAGPSRCCRRHRHFAAISATLPLPPRCHRRCLHTNCTLPSLPRCHYCRRAAAVIAVAVLPPPLPLCCHLHCASTAAALPPPPPPPPPPSPSFLLLSSFSLAKTTSASSLPFFFVDSCLSSCNCCCFHRQCSSGRISTLPARLPRRSRSHSSTRGI
jgi:hypothetical protein